MSALLAGQNLFRIAAVALGLSTLSFAAGVAGDLSIIDPPRTGERVVLRIPPELPADTIRAAPLPALISTASAEERPAREVRVARTPVMEAEVEPKEKPRAEPVLASAKPNQDRAPKGDERTAA